MNRLLRELEKLTLVPKKRSVSVSKKEYEFKPTAEKTITITSYKFSDFGYRKPDNYPTLARGLFIRSNGKDREIVIRGYDKFFNIGEVPSCQWSSLESNTIGPYVMTLKENGCILLVSQVDGHLIVASKHALGKSHAEKGEEWIKYYINKRGISELEIVEYLQKRNLTAVFELADDDFEEHILSYPKEKSGLYLHGLNRNTVEFESLNMDAVKEFADLLGCHVVENFTLETIMDVKKFTNECAKTGSYQNRPIEGFVVRCANTDGTTKFFKVKFDEPYLMFREWREVTKALLGNREPRFKFQLTRKYISWVKQKIKQQPSLFESYMINKGIIQVRNMFLFESENVQTMEGVNLQEFCKEVQVEQTSTTKGESKRLIIPIAIVGVGKTTLGKCLTKLFPAQIAQIQNDNITSKKNKSTAFGNLILAEFKNHDIVYADRNNHLFQHRRALCDTFLAEFPAGEIIALDWGIDFMDKKELKEFATTRIINRGENHQTLTTTTADVERVVNMFIYERDPLDLNTDHDRQIKKIVDFSIYDPIQDQIQKVCSALELECPSLEKIESAMEEIRNEKVSIKILPSKPKPKYFGVSIDSDLFSILDNFFANNPNNFWKEHRNKVEKQGQNSFHVTIVLRSRKSENSELFNQFQNRYMDFLNNTGDVSDPLRIGAKVTMVCSRLLLNDKVLTLLVDSSDPHFDSLSQQRHITLAILEVGIKPNESNSLIKQYLQNPESVECLTFQPISLEGHITAFF